MRSLFQIYITDQRTVKICSLNDGVNDSKKACALDIGCGTVKTRVTRKESSDVDTPNVDTLPRKATPRGVNTDVYVIFAPLNTRVESLHEDTMMCSCQHSEKNTQCMISPCRPCAMHGVRRTS